VVVALYVLLENVRKGIALLSIKNTESVF